MNPTRKARLFRWLTRSLVVVFLLIFGAVSTLAWVNAQRVDTLHQVLASTRTTDESLYGSLLGKYTKTYDQLVRAGETPSQTSPTNIAPLPGPRGETGATGAAGTAGVNGLNGTNGVSIVSASCSGSGLSLFYSDGSQENAGQCLGAAGKNGATGATGATGAPGASVVGPAGPTGPAGPAGPAGQDGKDGTNGTNGTDGANGVGVSTVTCVLQSDGTTAFRFTLTDGTTRDVGGICTPTPNQ